MNIVITGSSGFLGKTVKEYLLNKGHNVISVYRNDFIDSDLLYNKIENCDVIINFAGEPIIKRWNANNKKSILESRIYTTQKIVSYLNENKKNVHLINTSAIGIYNTISKHDENSLDYANNFLSEVVLKWENEANKLNTDINKLTIIRIGVVLANSGGAFPVYKKLTKQFLGAIFGNGKQWMSFIHIDDFCRAIDFIVTNKVFGVVNLTCPNPTTNKNFTKSLCTYLKRPLFFIVPKIFLRIIFGESHILFTDSQYVISKKLNNYGFTFNYTNIGDSFKALI